MIISFSNINHWYQSQNNVRLASIGPLNHDSLNFISKNFVPCNFLLWFHIFSNLVRVDRHKGKTTGSTANTANTVVAARTEGFGIDGYNTRFLILFLDQSELFEFFTFDLKISFPAQHTRGPITFAAPEMTLKAYSRESQLTLRSQWSFEKSTLLELSKSSISFSHSSSTFFIWSLSIKR